MPGAAPTGLQQERQLHRVSTTDPEAPLLTLEPLFQFVEDGISRLLRVLVVALAVLGLVVAPQVVLFQHRHDFFAY